MSIEFDFSDRSVVVSGAAQGLGAAIVRRFAAAGAAVLALDRDEGALAEAWGDTEGVVTEVCDVSDAQSVERTIALRGQVDVLVNNAGIVRDAVVWKMTDQAWSDVLAVHLTGTFNLTRATIPVMRASNYGRIVNVTSYSGLHGNIGQANYAAAKAGICGFSRTVAKEVARFGITVNVVSPNARTPMVAALSDDKVHELTALVPLGRFGEPSEVADVVSFLSCEEAGYITGAVLPVDGGMSM